MRHRRRLATLTPFAVATALATSAQAGGKTLTPDTIHELESELAALDGWKATLAKATATLGAAHDVFAGVFVRWYFKDGSRCQMLELAQSDGAAFVQVADADAALCGWKPASGKVKAALYGKPFAPKAVLAAGSSLINDSLTVRVFDFAATCESISLGAELPTGTRYLELSVPWKRGATRALADNGNAARFERVKPKADDALPTETHYADGGEIKVGAITTTASGLARITVKAAHAKQAGAGESADSFEGELDVRFCE